VYKTTHTEPVSKLLSGGTEQCDVRPVKRVNVPLPMTASGTTWHELASLSREKLTTLVAAQRLQVASVHAVSLAWFTRPLGWSSKQTTSTNIPSRSVLGTHEPQLQSWNFDAFNTFPHSEPLKPVIKPAQVFGGTYVGAGVGGAAVLGCNVVGANVARPQLKKPLNCK
jgi:hypothetical protein